jgi:glycosyltransferase involved in cell wall biosynthesis
VKILLVQNTTYLPTYGGANRANRCIIEELAERKHICQAIVPLRGASELRTQENLRSELAQQAIPLTFLSSEVLIFHHRGVEVHVVTETTRLSSYVARQIRSFEPTWTLVASEDPGQILLETALKNSPRRVVYIAHTTMMLPFGNNHVLSGSTRTEQLSQVAGIITISHYLKGVIKQQSGLEAAVLHAPMYGQGPYASFGRFEAGFVTMINPCAVKGMSIFAELARRMPDIPFAAVTSWGTTDRDRAALGQLPNVSILAPSSNIDDFLKYTRILLVPSLWDEAFGTIVTEAMLRGIPVLASNVGGLPEAKLGIDYVLPVRPIEEYTDKLDDKLLPVPVVPDQDIGPWLAALSQLLSDRKAYEQLAETSRAAAHTYVSQLSIEPFEHYLEHLTQPEHLHNNDKPKVMADPTTVNMHKHIEQLSPERRALLTQRLLRKAKNTPH